MTKNLMQLTKKELVELLMKGGDDEGEEVNRLREVRDLVVAQRQVAEAQILAPKADRDLGSLQDKPVAVAKNLDLAILLAVAACGKAVVAKGRDKGKTCYYGQWPTYKRLFPELLDLGFGAVPQAQVRDSIRTLVETHKLIPNGKGKVVTYKTNDAREPQFRITGKNLAKYTAAFLSR